MLVKVRMLRVANHFQRKSAKKKDTREELSGYALPTKNDFASENLHHLFSAIL
jgi:hypothetical protein